MRKENTIKKQQLLKQPVKIRYKLLKNNNKSLYLDTYINGKRQYEFLHLYLIPEIDENCRLINQQVLKRAYTIQAERILSIYGLASTKTSRLPDPHRLHGSVG